MLAKISEHVQIERAETSKLLAFVVLRQRYNGSSARMRWQTSKIAQTLHNNFNCQNCRSCLCKSQHHPNLRVGEPQTQVVKLASLYIFCRQGCLKLHCSGVICSSKCMKCYHLVMNKTVLHCIACSPHKSSMQHVGFYCRPTLSLPGLPHTFYDAAQIK